MGEMIKVGIADMKICKFPDKLTTLGLGSCVGVAIMDPENQICGLIHIMMPDSTIIKNNSNKCKYADTGVHYMIEAMVETGAVKENMVAKLAGGAKMFNMNGLSDTMNIGERNIMGVKKALAEHGIEIIAEDVGKDYGRTVVFDSEDGSLLIKSVGKPEKKI